MSLIKTLNGIDILYKKKESLTSSINIMFKCGSINEKTGNIGMSHLLEHLILSNKKIKTLITKGAIFNGTTEPHVTSYYFDCPTDVFSKLITIFADIILFKDFDYNRLDKEKDVVIQEIKNCIDDPTCYLYCKFKRLLFNKSKLKYETVGLEKDIKAITKKDIKDYFKKHYTKSSMVVSIVSDIPSGDILNYITDSSLSKLPKGKKIPSPTNYPSDQTQFIHKSFPIKKDKSYFIIGTIVEKEDLYSCKILLKILAGDLHSRLYKKLRNKGYVYSIKTELNYFNDYGSLIICSSCDPSKLQTCLDIIINEFNLLTKKITDKELQNTLSNNRGTLLIHLDNPSNLSNFMGKQYIIGETIDINEHLNYFDDITITDLKKTAKRYLSKSNLTIVTN